LNSNKISIQPKQATDRDKENREASSKLMAGIDNLEDLIRKRLGAVQVVS
jgi:hypothetical protein